MGRNLNNVKIFVLYLMKNINYPMDFSTVNDIVMQNDYIMYLDFEEAFHQMLGQGLIREDGKDEHGNALYSVTRQGAIVAEELKSDILPAILDQSLSCALRYLDFRARGVTVDTDSQKRADNTFDVTLTLKEKGKVLFSTTVNVDSALRSQQIRESFRDRPDVIYRATLALLAGKVNYLFDK
ncbi:MAG: DUF4364 family protein [Clostridia bacterium]|nr:DUF4364 family protein [Clostridia bacterium]